MYARERYASMIISVRQFISNYITRFWGKALTILITTFIWAVLVICIHLSPAHGAGMDDIPLEAKAKAHLDKGEFDQAMQTYFELFKQDPDNPDINFSLGRAAFENGDYEAAIMAFERVLIGHPEAARAKLEMARSYYHLGSLENAEQYFDEVLRVNPPDVVRTNINKYLQAIKAQKKEHFFSAKLSLGLDFDSNVNASPTNPDIGITTSLGNITVSVNRPEKDQIYNSTASMDYVYRPIDSKVSFKFSGTNYIAVYRDTDDLDTNLFDIKTGLSIGRDRLIWDVYGIANHLILDYNSYLRIYGTGSSLKFVVTPAFLLGIDGKFKKKDYVDDDTRDADNLSFTMSPVIAYGRNRVTLSVGLEHENAREDVYTYTKFNGIATYEIRLPYAASAYVSYWYQGTDYKDLYTLFGKKRSDNVQYVTTGLSKNIMVWKSASRNVETDLNLGYTYTRSDSNIDLYTYTKNVVSAALSVTF